MADDPARDNVTAIVVDVALPEPDLTRAGEPNAIDRPPTAPDAAAWTSPRAARADQIPHTDQETSHAREHDH